MQVSHDDIKNYYSTFSSFDSTIHQLKANSYNTNTTSNLKKKIDYGTWQDEVQKKLQICTDDLADNVAPGIENSIEGDFNNMCDIATKLNQEAENYKGYNSTFHSITKEEADADEKKAKTKSTASTNRDNSLRQINKYLAELAKIDFNSQRSTSTETTSAPSDGQTRVPHINPNYDPVKPDYEAWNRGMYGEGYWNSDGTHNEGKGGSVGTNNEGKGGSNYNSTFRGQDNVTVNGNIVTITATGLNPGQANTGAPQTETVSFNATTLKNGMIYLQGENRLNYIYNPNTNAFYDVTGHGKNDSNAPADIISKYSGADAGDLLFKLGGNSSASSLLNWSIGMRNDGYYHGQVGVGTKTY